MSAYYQAVGLVFLITAVVLGADVGGTVHPDAGLPLWVAARAAASPLRQEYQLRRSGDGYVYIERFIGRQLPCGSPDAYPPAELQAYQGSEPGRAFSPYGACER